MSKENERMDLDEAIEIVGLVLLQYYEDWDSTASATIDKAWLRILASLEGVD